MKLGKANSNKDPVSSQAWKKQCASSTWDAYAC